MWKKNSGSLVSLAVLAFDVYILPPSGRFTVSWITSTKPINYTLPEAPTSDISELPTPTRLQALERVLYEFGSDSRHFQQGIENNLTKSVSDSPEGVSARA